MRLTALQLPARFDCADAQLALVDALLARAPTDLALLPEAALCGYLSDDGACALARFAEPREGPTRARYAALAKKHDCALVGPLIEREGEACFNALTGVTPDGATLLHYRKRHPWFPEAWATAGAESGPVVEWRGAKLLAAICFDAHFLEADAAAQLDAADVLLFASAWVGEAGTKEEVLAPLAQAHQLAVLNANWGEGSPRVVGQGGSCFFDARGEVVVRLDGAPGRVDVAWACGM